MPSVYIKTYGCQMNERDSEAVAAQLQAKGYTLVKSEAAADVILLNTCSVRDMAEQKALRKMENVAAEIRRSRPEVVLGFMGCMAQSRGQELIDRLPDVDLVLGTQKFHRAADYLDELISGAREKIVDISAEQGSEAAIREHLLNGKAGKAVTAYVSIMQGCNQYCTFCIVPYTRGEERSRTIPDIVAECRELVSRGVKEITLLGQIVTSYGKRGNVSLASHGTSGERGNLDNRLLTPGLSTNPSDEPRNLIQPPPHEPSPHPDPLPSHPMGAEREQQADTNCLIKARRPESGSGVQCADFPGNSHPGPLPRGGEGALQGVNAQFRTNLSSIGGERGKTPFVQLLEAVHEIDGIERIRFTAPHPKGYGDDLIECYSRLPKLVESAHIPVQSGSDRVLKLMHRGYTRSRFLDIIQKLRRAKPGIGIVTDIIVGFPGETEDDFEQTLSLCREVEFDNAYIFKYSPRRDTPAADMPDQVPQKVREERNQRLLKTVNEIAARQYKRFVGQQTQILVEGPSRKNPARLAGRTRCNKIVLFEGNERHRGQIMDLKITRAGNFTLYGDPAIVNL
jgi:tRNA A37 methylthiotransferase MiaB